MKLIETCFLSLNFGLFQSNGTFLSKRGAQSQNFVLIRKLNYLGFDSFHLAPKLSTQTTKIDI